MRLQRNQLIGRTPVRTLLDPGGESHGSAGAEFGSCGPGGAAGLRDIEPLFLPLLYCIHKSAFRSGDDGQLTHRGSSALRVLAFHHLRLHIEDFEP